MLSCCCVCVCLILAILPYEGPWPNCVAWLCGYGWSTLPVGWTCHCEYYLSKPLQTNKYKPTSHHESNSFTCLELGMLAMTESTSEKWSLSAFASCLYSFIMVHVVSVLLVILCIVPGLFLHSYGDSKDSRLAFCHLLRSNPDWSTPLPWVCLWLHPSMFVLVHLCWSTP